jgi:hypothetical protein
MSLVGSLAVTKKHGPRAAQIVSRVLVVAVVATSVALFVLGAIVRSEGVPSYGDVLTPAARALHSVCAFGALPLLFASVAVIAISSTTRSRTDLVILAFTVPTTLVGYATWAGMGW